MNAKGPFLVLSLVGMSFLAGVPVLAQSTPGSGEKEALVRVITRWDSVCHEPNRIVGDDWGHDHWNDRPDDDVYFAGLRGSHNNSVGHWLGTVRVDEPGGGNCWPNKNFMELGDKDLEFPRLSSGHSMWALTGRGSACACGPRFRHPA